MCCPECRGQPVTRVPCTLQNSDLCRVTAAPQLKETSPSDSQSPERPPGPHPQMVRAGASAGSSVSRGREDWPCVPDSGVLCLPGACPLELWVGTERTAPVWQAPTCRPCPASPTPVPPRTQPPRSLPVSSAVWKCCRKGPVGRCDKLLLTTAQRRRRWLESCRVLPL